MLFGIHRTSTRLALVAAGAVLALAAAGCGSSSHPVSRGNDTVAASIPVTPANPYYPLLAASSQPTVSYGARVGGCDVRPMARCAGVRVPRAMLQGALFGGADLTGADLSGAGLALATFSGATLTGADLSHTTLTGAALNRVSGKGLSLAGARVVLAAIDDSDLEGADLQGLDADFGAIIGTNAAGADLRGADLADTDFNGDDFANADLAGANLSNADLTGSTLTGADMTGAVFCNTVMPDGSVRSPQAALCPGQAAKAPAAPAISVPRTSPYYAAVRALSGGSQIMSGTVVGGCRIQAYTRCPGAPLSHRSLQGAFLAYADLDKADLGSDNFNLGSIAFGHARGADMDSIQLGGTAAVNVGFAGASLRSAQMSLANLVGTDLQGADLSRVDGRLAAFDSANLKGADLSRARLGEASLVGANLTGANLSGADLSGADLLGATMGGAKLGGVRYCNTVMPDGTIKNPGAGCA